MFVLDRRRVGIVLAVAAAVALVALAARGDSAEQRLSWALPATATGATQAMLVILFGLLALGVVVLTVWAMFPERGGGKIEPRRRTRSIVGTLIGLVLVLTAFGLAPRRADDEDGGSRGSTMSGRAPAAGSDGHPSASPNWGLGLAGVVLLVGVTGIVMLRRRPPPLDLPDDPPAAVPSSDTRAGAVTAAEQCADPRRAVLLAFAAAEVLLAVDPSTRRPPSTSAREWARTVRSAPLSTIVARYELARFSHHAVTDDDRRAALDALAALR